MSPWTTLMLVHVDEAKDMFKFDLDKSSTFHYDADRVEEGGGSDMRI